MTFLIALMVPAVFVPLVWFFSRPKRGDMVFAIDSQRENARAAMSAEPLCAGCKVRRAQERMAERLHREGVSA